MPSLTGFDRVLVKENEAAALTASARGQGQDVSVLEVRELPRAGALFEEGGRSAIGACLTCLTPAEQGSAMSLVGSVSWICVDEATQKMIAAENLLSAAEGTPTKLAVTVAT